MLSAIVSAVWAVAPGLITGIVLAAFSRRQKRRDDAAEEKAETDDIPMARLPEMKKAGEPAS